MGSRKLLDPERLTHVYVSPRKRAVQTFEILLPSSFSKGSEKVSYTEDIAEWNYGSYEGMKNLDIREKRKNNGLDTERAWDIWTDGCEEGEYVAFQSAPYGQPSLIRKITPASCRAVGQADR